jgi:hypothetical protein
VPHPLVDQLRFTRSEFVRGLGDVGDPLAQRRFGKMNCISWMVGHLAWQEQRYWLYRAQGQVLIPELNELLAYGKPASTPPVEEMWAAWRQVTRSADPWLDQLTSESLQAPLALGFSSVGTFIHRVIYHYWYHLGEGLAVRQLLEQSDLPEFVGDIDSQAPYQPEPAGGSGGAAGKQIDKAGFIDLVRETHARWEALLAQLDDSRMLQPGVDGDWSVKDVIAHIAWHERQMVQVLQSRALIGSELWDLPLDQRNQAIYEENKDLSLEEARTQAAETYRLLLQELEALSEEELHDPGRYAGMPPDWQPWQLFAENTYQHYQDHLTDVRIWMKAN